MASTKNSSIAAWLAITVLDYGRLEKEFTDFGRITIPVFLKTVMVYRKIYSNLGNYGFIDIIVIF